MGGVSIFQILMLIGVLILVYIHFLPTIIALKKNHKNKVPIILINIFLGWSLVGWVVALVWATKKAEGVIVENNVGSQADELEKLHSLKEKGVLTDAEFAKKKAEIIG
tara:strand:- start:786 stop:1109 length:324 start_codon:yes stop_codon:yes gene_type:complete